MNCCNANGQCTLSAECPVLPTARRVMPFHVAQAIGEANRKVKAARISKRTPCDELGVCNCNGRHCDFDLPDLGPMTKGERILLAVIYTASASIMVTLGVWVYYR